MEVIAKTEGLKKYYGEGAGLVKALDGIDLEIEKGKFTMIVGTSGSGKTTFLNLLGGQDRPTEGSIYVDGARIDTLKEPQLAVYRRNKVGFIYQNFNLIPMLTVEENILFPLEVCILIPGHCKGRQLIRKYIGCIWYQHHIHGDVRIRLLKLPDS